ncbi:flagellin N-terminal helical domain-containing protein [Paraburkholderia adhaesiva]|uniref:flagellin N-terminal helical domain-containing protein n=1 Tax=Paraburkholderia adhaesiva TaxID=2883244 RepID=UPI001F1BA16A|nr:flagellin [Paraburkholderia adhaesiva]
MLSINTNVSSLIAQNNVTNTGSALTQAITRLSSGKRINSAADDPAGIAIASTLQTSINGLNQGVSNANNAVSMVQTAGSALMQIQNALQSIYQAADDALGPDNTSANMASYQKTVSQQIAEVNRIASQTTFNGLNLLNGTAGILHVQVGVAVGQTVSLDLSQSLSAANLGGGYVQAGNTLGQLTGVNLNSDGSENTSGNPGSITSINVMSNGSGGFIFTDQNNQVISSGASANLFKSVTTSGVTTLQLNAGGTSGLVQSKAVTAINAAFTATGASALSGTVFGTISGLNVDPSTGKTETTPGTAGVITSVSVQSNGNGGELFYDQNGNQLSNSAVNGLFGATSGATLALQGNIENTFDGESVATGTDVGGVATSAADVSGVFSTLGQINTNNTPTNVASINVSTTAGANLGLEVVNNALATIANQLATLGSVQTRFTGLATAQQSASTNMSSAQSTIQDADFASESAAMSKAQVLQQAGISVLAQANSQPQQILKLLQ